MTDDELANYFKVGFDALHARVDEEPEGYRKRRATQLVDRMHAAANELKHLAADGGLIQPMSGGEPKV